MAAKKQNAEVILWVRITPQQAKGLDAAVSRAIKRQKGHAIVSVSRSSIMRDALAIYLRAEEGIRSADMNVDDIVQMALDALEATALLEAKRA